MRQIPLSKFRAFALVDDEDFDWLDAVGPWQFACGRYGRRFEYCNGKRTVIWMHRAILKPPPDMNVDHIDGNGLNNQKINLRIATQNQNVWNTGRRAAGGHPHWQTGRYRSQIWHCGKKLDVGFFDTLEEAREAHAFCAYHLRGEFGTYEKTPDFDASKLGPSMRARIEMAQRGGTTKEDR